MTKSNVPELFDDYFGIRGAAGYDGAFTREELCDEQLEVTNLGVNNHAY